MGIFQKMASGAKSAVGWNQLKGLNSYLSGFGKNLWSETKEQPGASKKMADLGYKEKDLAKTSLVFRRLFILYFSFAVLAAIYGIIKLFMHDHLSTWVSLCVVLVCLAQSFKYHFWLFQIRKGKVGCSLQEWLQDLTARGK